MIKPIAVVRVSILQSRSEFVREAELHPPAGIPTGQDIVSCIYYTVVSDAHKTIIDVFKGRNRKVVRPHVNFGEGAAPGGVKKKALPGKPDLCPRVPAPILLCVPRGQIPCILCDRGRVGGSDWRRGRKIRDEKPMCLKIASN